MLMMLLICFQILGTPTEEVWEGFTQYPHYDMSKPREQGGSRGEQAREQEGVVT